MLKRIQIRSAIVAALSAAAAPYPTLAGPQVFDSRLDNIWDQTPEGPMPAVLVYTDDDDQDLLDTASGRGAYARKLTVCIELVVGSFSSGELAEFNLAQTDPEMEALLDILEWQVWNALNDPLSDAATTLMNLHKGWMSWNSSAARSGDKQQRLAARRITASLKVAQECVMPVDFDDTVQPDAIDAATPLFDADYLGPLSDLLLGREDLAGVVDMIRWQQGGPVPAARVLERGFKIVFKADFIDPADPNRLPPGETKGPDGRVEVVFSTNV